MKLVKSTGLALSVCVLFSSQMFAADFLSTDDNTQNSAVKIQAVQPAAANTMVIPHTFTANTPAVADEVNANFVAAKTTVDLNGADIELMKATILDLQTKLGGPKLNVSEAVLQSQGWSVCFSETFDQNSVSAIADILTACSGADLMLACRDVGNPNFVLAASAPRADVTLDTTTDTTTTNNANGTEWYFNGTRSWGFALGGDAVSKNSCDVASTNAEYRMCMHASGDALTGGYRCGATTGLNSSATWERVILHK